MRHEKFPVSISHPVHGLLSSLSSQFLPSVIVSLNNACYCYVISLNGKAFMKLLYLLTAIIHEDIIDPFGRPESAVITISHTSIRSLVRPPPLFKSKQNKFQVEILARL